MQADDAIQRLYEDIDLRDELVDDDADTLLKWAEAQIMRLAEANADESQFDEFFDNLRKLVKGINRFIGRRDELDADAQTTRIDNLIGAAQGIGATVVGAQSSDLVQQVANLDSSSLVKTLTTLFTPATLTPETLNNALAQTAQNVTSNIQQTVNDTLQNWQQSAQSAPQTPDTTHDDTPPPPVDLAQVQQIMGGFFGKPQSDQGEDTPTPPVDLAQIQQLVGGFLAQQQGDQAEGEEDAAPSAANDIGEIMKRIQDNAGAVQELLNNNADAIQQAKDNLPATLTALLGQHLAAQPDEDTHNDLPSNVHDTETTVSTYLTDEAIDDEEDTAPTLTIDDTLLEPIDNDDAPADQAPPVPPLMQNLISFFKTQANKALDEDNDNETKEIPPPTSE